MSQGLVMAACSPSSRRIDGTTAVDPLPSVANDSFEGPNRSSAFWRVPRLPL
jgi:hypothetical protein